MSRIVPDAGVSGTGRHCCAYGCTKRQKKISAMSYVRSNSDGSSDEESIVKRRYPRTFHRFPTNESLKERWIKCLKRKDWVPTRSSVVCSDHFVESVIYRLGQRICLRENAVPTRFLNFPKYIRPKYNFSKKTKKLGFQKLKSKTKDRKVKEKTKRIKRTSNSIGIGTKEFLVVQDFSCQVGESYVRKEMHGRLLKLSLVNLEKVGCT